MSEVNEMSDGSRGAVIAPRDILDEARDFLKPHGSADEVARYPVASLVLRLADELRQTRAAFGDLDEHEKLIAQLGSQLDGCCKKLWVEWVPVAEQLPTRDQVVLVAWEGFELVTLGHFIDGDWFDPVVAISEYGPPTHWMPLPIGPRPPLPAPPADGE